MYRMPDRYFEAPEPDPHEEALFEQVYNEMTEANCGITPSDDEVWREVDFRIEAAREEFFEHKAQARAENRE